MQGKTILVVDDDPLIPQLLKVFLQHHGFTILLASGGRDALEVLARNHVDLVLSDVNMPGGSGPDLYDTLAATPSAPPLIFMTGGHNPAELNDRVKASGRPSLKKPFTPLSRVTDAIERELGIVRTIPP